MLVGNRPYKNPDYWEWRLQDRFRAVDNVETELTRIYAQAYESIWNDYKKLTKDFLKADGTIDYGRLSTALKMDSRLQRKASRYQDLLNRIDKITDNLGNQETTTIEKLLMDTYKNNYYETLFQMESEIGYKTEFTLLTTSDRLKQIVHTKWSEDGIEFSDRIWKDKRKLNQQLRELIQDGISTGKSPQQTARLLRKQMGGKLYCSQRIVRTETLSMITESDSAAYAEIGFEKYKILSTFDKRTSRICQLMNGKEFINSEMKIGTNAPPFHPNCRSTIEPVMEETTATRYAKDINGKRVKIPTDMTYEEFRSQHLINY